GIVAPGRRELLTFHRDGVAYDDELHRSRPPVAVFLEASRTPVPPSSRASGCWGQTPRAQPEGSDPLARLGQPSGEQSAASGEIGTGEQSAFEPSAVSQARVHPVNSKWPRSAEASRGRSSFRIPVSPYPRIPVFPIPPFP